MTDKCSQVCKSDVLLTGEVYHTGNIRNKSSCITSCSCFQHIQEAFPVARCYVAYKVTRKHPHRDHIQNLP